jgi:hypothetical protein
MQLKKGDRELITFGAEDHIEIWKVDKLDEYESDMTVKAAYTEVGFFS